MLLCAVKVFMVVEIDVDEIEMILIPILLALLQLLNRNSRL